MGFSSNGLGTGSGGSLDNSYSSITIIEDVKATGVNSGTFTDGAWQDRDLNTLSGDNASMEVTLSDNQFTLYPGKYKIEWECPAMAVDEHMSRLYNVTDSTTQKLGSVSNAGDIETNTESLGFWAGTLTKSTTFMLQHYCRTTNTTDGFGEDFDFGGFSEDNIFSRVIITTLSDITFTPEVTTSSLENATLDYIDVTFNRAMYNTNRDIGALVAADFDLNFLQNGGTATAGSITSLKTTGDAALSGGETTIRFNLSFTGTPDGLESIEIAPTDNTSVFGIGGEAMPSTNTTGAILLDQFLYFTNFSSGSVPAELTLIGTDTSTFFVGSGTFNTGGNSLYISDDSGVTNNFDETITSDSHAYIDFDLTGFTTATLTFDYKYTADKVGEIYYDYGAFRGGVGIAAPVDSVVYTGGTELVAKTESATDWTSESIDLTAHVGSTYRLVISWHNDGSSGGTGGLAVDFIKVAVT